MKKAQSLQAQNARHGLYLALAVLVLDQLVKAWMLFGLHIAERSPWTITPFLKLVMVWNRGVSFGMLNGEGAHAAQPLLLILLALFIVAVLLHWLTTSANRLAALAIGCVIGGAIGNVIDRFLFGGVADFFYFHLGEYYWPAFNIADAGICLGVALLVLESMLCRK